MLVKDQLNRTHFFSTPPKRIISLVPSQTELLVHLGLEKYLIGVTKFCVHPKVLRKRVSIIGGTKKVNLSKIKALSPDIIIGNKEENTKEIVVSCEKIAPVWVSDIATINDALKMIGSLGFLFEAQEVANKLIATIALERDIFKEWVSKRALKKVLYLIPFKERHINEIKAHTTSKIQLVDGEYFSWYGSRLKNAFSYFKTLDLK